MIIDYLHLPLTWLPFSIFATVCFGVSAALYKIPTVKGHSKATNVFWMLASANILAFIFFRSHLAAVNPETLLLSLLCGVSYAGQFLLQMHALRRVPTNTFFPVVTTFSLVLSVVTGLLIFAERLSWLQAAGIILAMIAVYSFVRRKGEIPLMPVMLGILSSTILLSAFSKILLKVAANEVDIFAFQIYQYFFGFIFLCVVYLILNKGSLKPLFTKAALWGSLNGTLNFLGNLAFLVALTRGPFSLITSIHSNYILITALIGWIFFKETLSPRKIFLIGLAVVAVLLMRLG